VTFQRNANAPAGAPLIATMIAPGNVYLTFLQDGKQVVHAVISKDSKTNRWTVTGMDAKGKPIEGLEIWDKIAPGRKGSDSVYFSSTL